VRGVHSGVASASSAADVRLRRNSHVSVDSSAESLLDRHVTVIESTQGNR